jgi:hypothetical protein
MESLIKRLVAVLHQTSAERRLAASRGALDRYVSQMKKVEGGVQNMVMAADTAVELGSPQCLSLNAVLWTNEEDLVNDNAFWLLGDDLGELGPRGDYAQFVLLQIEAGRGPDPFEMESAQYLIRRLPGLMSRAIPGKLWFRISKSALRRNLDFSLIAAALLRAYKEEITGVIAVESVFVTSNKAHIEELKGLAMEARVIAGLHQKVSLGADGNYECNEFNCSNCDNQPVCDQIRKIATIRKKSRRQPPLYGNHG